MSKVVMVLTTLDADADVERFARQLVEERLAACVSVLAPMVSVYRWHGVLEQARERQLLIKTTEERVAALQARFRSLHPYELPECLVIPTIGGSSAYLSWIADGVVAPPSDSATTTRQEG